MSDERFDFEALKLEQDDVDRMVGRVMWRAQSELLRRAQAQNSGLLGAVAGWFRPAAVAAAAIAIVSLTSLASLLGNRANEPQTGAYMSSAEVPAAMTSWYEEDRLPTADELLLATAGE
jgi:hypothetical protein